MAITRPTTSQLMQIGQRLGMTLSEQDAAEYLACMASHLACYDLIDAEPDEIPAVKYPRTSGRRPAPNENPCNAWAVMCEVRGAPQGKLAGRTIALKDNISLAGVPMSNGARTLEGHVPIFDATIVTRMLNAGAMIKGKAVCEQFCLSGSSHTSNPLPVHNPHRHGYSAGGSSSGSAALVALGEVDMAIGGDQGGSIRIPATLCGLVGMKPTFGLVPYTGIMPIEATLDHTGPITSTVADNALLLEVLAGADGLDPRQYSPQVARYTEALHKSIAGLRIGVLTEGLALPNLEPGVRESVLAAAARLGALGAVVEDVSIPEHPLGAALWVPIGLEGLQWQMMLGNGMGMNWKGLYDVALMETHAAWRQRADDLSATMKLSMLLGQFGIDHYRGRYYAKAQNIARRLKQAYDQALTRHDLLLMPTLPITAQPLPGPDASITDMVSHAFEMLGNTAQFDITGHPALSVPCGTQDGLPIGMMLVGSYWQESTLYQAASAFETTGD